MLQVIVMLSGGALSAGHSRTLSLRHVDFEPDCLLLPQFSVNMLQRDRLMQDDITRKGVVFNEMKGVYSSPDSVNQRTVQHSLFPDNTYGEDSGGDPKIIPQLTFEEFQVLQLSLSLRYCCNYKPDPC